MAIDLSTLEQENAGKDGFFNENETEVAAAINATGWWRLTIDEEGQFTAAKAMTTAAEDNAAADDSGMRVNSSNDKGTFLYVHFNTEVVPSE